MNKPQFDLSLSDKPLQPLQDPLEMVFPYPAENKAGPRTQTTSQNSYLAYPVSTNFGSSE